MAEFPLDFQIAFLTRELKLCGDRAVALHAACCAERLMSIDNAYAIKEQHQAPDAAREALDITWTYLSGMLTDKSRLAALLPILDKAIPHADDCKTVEGLLVPYVYACIDTAIRFCLEDRSLGPIAIEYAFEALRKLESHLKTGYIDIGSGPEEENFEASLLVSPIICEELELQQEDLLEIRSGAVITSQLVNALRQRAMANRIDIAKYLG